MGNPTSSAYKLRPSVFLINVQNTGFVKNKLKYLNPTHGLPQTPCTTLYSLKAITALASLAQAQGKPAEVIAMLERASNAKPADIPAALRLGNAYLRTNEKQKATALAQRLVVSYPSSPEVLDFSAQTP